MVSRRARGTIVGLAMAARSALAGDARPLAARIDEAVEAATRAREWKLHAPLKVRTVSAHELAVALGEAPRATAAPRDPMLLDDDVARACLLGLRPLATCTRGEARNPDEHQDDPASRDGRAAPSAGAATPLAALAAGVYLPRERTLLLRQDDDSGADGTVLLHEIVHALQDARFGLATLLREDARGADALAARHAFVEGDASLAVLRDANLLEPLDDTFVEAFCRGFLLANRKSAPSLPAPLADAVVAPYVHGTRFVWSLYAHGGWPAVNTAWRRPPASTEQLLHVAKYRRGEQPLRLPRPPRPPAAFETRGTVAFGELDLRTWLGLFLGEGDAERLAADWGNGAAALYARGDERALTLRVRWDDHARGRAKDVAARLAAARGATCMERPGIGPMVIEAVGRDLLAVAGPANAHCDDVKRWGR